MAALLDGGAGVTMKLALQVPHFYSVPEAAIASWLADVVRAAEGGGLHSVWVMDHLFQLGGDDWLSPVESPMLEGYSTIGYLAAQTKTVELGVLVSPPTYRPPGLLIKTVTTLDVLSGGRMWLGLGAGWYAEEARGLGLPFPDRAERYVMLEETLRLARRMFDGDDRPFDGDHLHLARPLNSPPPARKGGPPILIGGDGKAKTLRLVAKYADACNLSGTYYASSEAIAESFETLRRHCREVARDYDEIERTVLDTFELRSPADFGEMVDRCREMAHVGVQTVIFNVPHAFDAETIDQVAVDVVPQVSAL